MLPISGLLFNSLVPSHPRKFLLTLKLLLTTGTLNIESSCFFFLNQGLHLFSLRELLFMFPLDSPPISSTGFRITWETHLCVGLCQCYQGCLTGQGWSILNGGTNLQTRVSEWIKKEKRRKPDAWQYFFLSAPWLQTQCDQAPWSCHHSYPCWHVPTMMACNLKPWTKINVFWSGFCQLFHHNSDRRK